MYISDYSIMQLMSLNLDVNVTMSIFIRLSMIF